MRVIKKKKTTTSGSGGCHQDGTRWCIDFTEMCSGSEAGSYVRLIRNYAPMCIDYASLSVESPRTR